MKLAATTIALGFLASSAWAQPYDLSWWTVDGGGTIASAGGTFRLGSTAGQPEAGGPLAGSPYALHGGFWAIAASAVAQADLSVTKTDGQSQAVPGQTVTYTVAVRNAGPSAANGATVADAPPAVVTGVTWTCTASPGSSCPASGSGPISHSVNLLNGGTATFTLTGTINPAATGTLVNTASVAPPVGVVDPSAANNSATDTDTLTPRADLALVLSDTPDPVGPGGALAYTIQVTSNGPSLSPGMTVTHTLPSAVTFVTSTPGAPACTHAGGVVTCTLGSLAPAAGTTVTVQTSVSLTATGTLASMATVTGSATDPVAANNSDTEITSVLIGPQADLSVTKTDGQSQAVPGQTVTYTVAVRNAGPSAATGATVADAPPAVVTGVTWICTASPGSSCPASGSGPISHAVNLLNGGTATFTLTGTISPAATGTLVNTASVAPPAGVVDPSAANNSAADTDTLTPRADLALVLSDTPDPVGPGGALAYTIQVTSNGPSLSPGMTVTHTLPSAVTFVTSTPGAPACTHAGGVVTCTLGSLAPAAGTTITVQTSVSPTATGTLSSMATVTGGATDPVAANNSDTESTSVLIDLPEGEVAHGTRLLADLAWAGGIADVDLYRMRQDPYASYELVVDGTSGDIGAGAGPGLDRVASDGTTVLQASSPIGAGASRSLRFANATSTAIADQLVRVRSLACGTDCGADDIYRLRAWDTTYVGPRFNNSGSQTTVLLIQNPTTHPVTATVLFWSASGALLATHTPGAPIGAKGLLVLNTASLPGLAGAGGSMTFVHNAPYGALVGKTVALEPATGFSFDSPMQPRPR